MKRLAALAVVGLACLSPAVSTAARPNVLFIAVDDLRPELGCYGNRVVKSPNIDRLADRGMTFTHAYCQQAVCSPSRTSMLTGLRPDATRVWDLETHFRTARPDCITLPQYFKMNGYHCAALGKIYHGHLEDGRSWSEPHWYPTGKAVDTDPADWSKQIVTKHDVSVHEYAQPPVPGGTRPGKGGTKGPAFEISTKSDDELPDGATAAEAVRRIRELKSRNEPFFLAVGFLKPHLPFVAPKKYWDLYDPAAIPRPGIDHLPAGAPPFVGHKNEELHAYAGVPAGEPIPADFARTLRHAYYACISYTDAQVGRLLDALDAEGLADDTIVVLWGDHGWQLGDHGLWHKHTNFELATRAPLLVSVPKAATAGKPCPAPVEFVDVYPTLADFCGLPIPEGLAGRSLRPFIEDPAAPMAKVAISQYPRSLGKGRQVMGYSIRDDRWRLTLWRERYGEKIVATELYDEQNDPAETTSLHDRPEHRGVIESLSKFLPSPIPRPERAAAEAKKPNIIFILADDLGVGNVGCYGADNYRTPNIDALAADGMRFSHAYTAPLCGPSRALVMTGRYAFRTGATNQDATGRMKPGTETMIPAYLAPAGYASCCVGKWNQLPLTPAEFGFDDSFLLNGHGVYWKDGTKSDTYLVNGVEKTLREREYMPDLMQSHVVQFIKRHRDQPFFLYYSLSHVHGKLQRTPDSDPASEDLLADNVSYMDRLVGGLVDTLDDLALREKTLVIFMGDNGSVQRPTIGGRRLSGDKGSMLEGGALVPLIANWPGTTPAGVVCGDLVDSTDFVPTFADLAGATLPKGKIIDGRTIAPQLRGQPGRPRPWVFIELGKSWYVRNADWKLNEKAELFDMRDAPFTEPAVPATDDTEASRAARDELAAALASLNPAGGILDDGDGSGRHTGNRKKKARTAAP